MVGKIYPIDQLRISIAVMMLAAPNKSKRNPYRTIFMMGM